MIDNHCTLEKTQAKVAKTINWKVVDNWREKLGAESNFEMMVDYDNGYYYDTRQLTRRSPFQSHVRLNIDKMIFTGCIEKKDVEMYKNVDITEPEDVDFEDEL
jgi:hypothetical protein